MSMLGIKEIVTSMITLTINDHEVKASEGMTVLEAAQAAGVYIPTLCYHPDLTPYCGCRLCIVEIEGMRGFPPACTTPAVDGMVVRTDTSQIHELRRGVLELILTEHPKCCGPMRGATWCFALGVGLQQSSRRI